jgi:methylglyoxal/glyoxal reductase
MEQRAARGRAGWGRLGSSTLEQAVLRPRRLTGPARADSLALSMKTQALKQTFPSTKESLKAAVTLNNGVRMPWLGLGVFQMKRDSEAAACVRLAIEQGYRSIDTAAIYGNERGVGEGVRTCGVPREELFITTKLWNDEIRRGRIEDAFDESMRRLGLDTVDLYLVHWPIAGKIVTAWKALEKLQRSGRIRAIGVSNHLILHLDELLAAAEIVPAVNQIEFHPYLRSTPLFDYCRTRDIRVEAWSPLMQAGPVLQDPVLTGIAQAHGRTVAQIILRWNVQSGVVTIPKSVKEHRIKENAAIFDFALTDAEMAAIDALDRGQRCGPDPFHFNF